MRSLSEIETISKRASRAIGFSWGVAEEIAKCIRLLELFGLPGVKNLNKYFKIVKKKKFENLIHINKDNKSKKQSYCPISLGVSFLDQIRTIENYKKITFYNIAYPVLFLPFLSRSSEIIGKKLLFSFDESKFLLNFNVSISSNFWNKKNPMLAKKVEISFLNNEDNFSDQDWKNLYKLAEGTFVDETDSLKEGAAGAGLTDND